MEAPNSFNRQSHVHHVLKQFQTADNETTTSTQPTICQQPGNMSESIQKDIKLSGLEKF